MGQDQRRKQFELLGAQARLEQLDKERAEIVAAKLDPLDEERAEIIEDYPELAQTNFKKRINGEALSSKRINVSDAARFSATLVDKARSERANFVKKRPYAARRQYDEAFKAQAVGRISNGEWLSDVGRSEKVPENVLRSWCKQRGIKPQLMPWDERSRRMRAARNGHALTAPIPHKLLPPSTVAKVPEVEFGAQKLSIRLALETLKAMPDDQGIHLKDLAKIMKEKVANVGWYLRKRKAAGHVASVGKNTGIYKKTAQGKKYELETLPPP